MDEDEDIQSHPAVTVAAAPPFTSTQSGGGREDCWSEGATSVLIEAWGERYMELSRGNLKQIHWKQVADIVCSRQHPPKTDIQCKNRIDTVKKKYKIEKAKLSSGNGPSRWPFFDRLHRLIGPSATPTPTPTPTKGLGFGVTVLSTGGPASSSGKSVPVGIPVGVRQQPLPLPFSPHYLQTPPRLQTLQQQLRHSFNFASPPTPMPHTNTSKSGGGVSNVNNITGVSQAQPQQLAVQQQQFRRHSPVVDSDEWSNDSGSRDSFPPERRREFDNRKRARIMEVDPHRGGGEGVKGKNSTKKGKEKKGGAVRKWGSSVRELTMAILKFGEAYEAAESNKLQHVKEMEIQRMKFAKEFELQKMKFMMKTQLELSQLNANGNDNGNCNASNNSDSRGGGGESNHHQHQHHHHHIHENDINPDANSDSSN